MPALLAFSTDFPLPLASWEALRCLSAGRRKARSEEKISPTGSGCGWALGGSGLAADGLVGSFWKSAPTGREPENSAPVGRFLPRRNEVDTGLDEDDDVADEDVAAADVEEMDVAAVVDSMAWAAE